MQCVKPLRKTMITILLQDTDFNLHTWPAANSFNNFNYFNNKSFNKFDDSNRYPRRSTLQSKIVVLDYILRTQLDAIYTGTTQDTTWKNFIYVILSVNINTEWNNS